MIQRHNIMLVNASKSKSKDNFTTIFRLLKLKNTAVPQALANLYSTEFGNEESETFSRQNQSES